MVESARTVIFTDHGATIGIMKQGKRGGGEGRGNISGGGMRS